MNASGYNLEIMRIVDSIPPENRSAFAQALVASEKNPVVLFGFNIWLGWLGIDRFLVGDVVAGVLKLITFGGFGIWQLIDCFLIGGRARDKNIALARNLRDSFARTSGGSPAPVAAPSDNGEG